MPTIIGSMIIAAAILIQTNGYLETIGYIISLMILTPIAVGVYVVSRALWEWRVDTW